MISRRGFLHQSMITGSGFLLPRQLLAQGNRETELRIPPELLGERRGDQLHYDLEAQTGNSRFFADLQTPTIGFNGSYLGPTLRLRDGNDVSINVSNRLGEPTTVHWHGLHVPASADGGPHQLIEDGRSWSAQFTVRQNAGPFWYHSHLVDRTGEQVYRGLSGMLIVDDAESTGLELPSEYGVDDIPLIIQDRRFNADGSFQYVSSHRDIMMGMHGDRLLVNGTLNPYFVPRTRKVRFRLLNGSNARTYNIAFSDGRSFEQLGCDGGFLSQPLPMTVLTLAPAERCEIVVDFSDGAPVNMVSLPMAADSPNRMQNMMGRRMGFDNDSFQVLSIRPQSGLAPSPELPIRLTEVADFESVGIDRERRFELSMAMGRGMMAGGRGGGRGQRSSDQFFINGTTMHMAAINVRVPIGSTEIWEIHNQSPMMHPFHIHHGQFQLLTRNGRPPHAHERAYKDTVKVGPGETVRVVMEFLHYSDPDVPYMYHCHILEHEDNGMMGQFLVE